MDRLMTHLLFVVLVVMMVVVMLVLASCTVVVEAVTTVGVVMGVVVEFWSVELMCCCCPWKNMCPPNKLHPSKVLLLYMYPVTLLCSLLNLVFCLTLTLLCLNSFILLMSKLHCVRSLS